MPRGARRPIHMPLLERRAYPPLQTGPTLFRVLHTQGDLAGDERSVHSVAVAQKYYLDKSGSKPTTSKLIFHKGLLEKITVLTVFRVQY